MIIPIFGVVYTVILDMPRPEIKPIAAGFNHVPFVSATSPFLSVHLWVECFDV